MIIFVKEIVRSCKPNEWGKLLAPPSPFLLKGECNLKASKNER